MPSDPTSPPSPPELVSSVSAARASRREAVFWLLVVLGTLFVALGGLVLLAALGADDY